MSRRGQSAGSELAGRKELRLTVGCGDADVLHNFVTPRVAGIASKTFFYNAISDWNALPPEIQSIENKLEFKRAVKKHLSEMALRQESDDFLRM